MSKSLGSARLRELFDYNSETGTLTRKPRPRIDFRTNGSFRTWNTKNVGKVAGFAHNRGYLQANVCGELHLVHRIIWEWCNGPIPDGMQVDHINGVRSDNRLSNLRLATPAENAHNAKRHSDGLSMKGVHYAKHRAHLPSPWRARIMLGGTSVDLGCFTTAEEAHSAYSAAANELHGQFARTQ